MSTMQIAALLRPVEHALNFISTTKVHSTYFPYLLAPTLHAARISIAFQNQVRASKSRLSWGTYLAGFLVMSWGGTLINHFLLSLPAPQLYSFHPYINYLSVHLVLTVFFYVFPSALNPRVLDTALVPLDALLRTNAVTLSLGLLEPPPTSSSSPRISLVNPLLKNSPLTHLIVGAVASSGGGVTAATLSVWTPDWRLSTPVFLRGGGGYISSAIGTVDVWGGALVAFIYDLLTASSALSPADAPVYPIIYFLHLEAAPVYSPLGAKAAGAVALGSLFAGRVWWNHWSGAATAKGGKKVSGEKTKVQ